MRRKIEFSKWNRNKVENIYFLIALVLGSLFAFLTPPFQVTDETAHFYRAALIAEGNMLSIQGEIPGSIRLFAEDIESLNLEHEPDNKVDPGILFKGWLMPLQKDIKGQVAAPFTENYSPILYAPQTMGAAIGMGFGFSPYKLLLISRLFNLVCCVLLTTLAIKVCPFRKWSLALIALVPMSLSLYGSASPDALNLAYSFFYGSLILYFRQNGLPPKKRVWVVLATLLLAFLKPGYGFLCLLVFLLPIFPQKKLWDWSAKIGIVLATFLLFSAWFMVSENFGPKMYMALPGVDAAGQLKFILSNPFVFMRTYFHDLFDGLAGAVVTFIGVFGWVDTVMPYWIYVIYEFSLGFALIFDNNYAAEPLQKARYFVLAIFLVNFLILYGIFYFTFTPVGADFIIGFQGRYVLPIAALPFFAFHNKRKKFQFNKIYLLVLIWVLGGLAAILTILSRYYG